LRLSRIIIVSILAVILAVAQASAAETVQLSTAGKALQQVVVAESATETTRTIAWELANYLGRITGAPFEVTVGDGTSGIAIGRFSDFPRLRLAHEWDSNNISRREDYLLRSHSHGLYVIGATDIAETNAMWDLLYRLGYRQYFPGANWEIIPKKSDLAIAIDASEHPSYFLRSIWYGYGQWDINSKAFLDWKSKNRITVKPTLKFAHSYRGIYERNIKAFNLHPEYLCNNKDVKFRISNAGLRQLVIDDAMLQIEKYPEFDGISLEPSDGGGWCDSEEIPNIKNISDRVLFLANEVAAAINDKYPRKIIGMLAYNYHSPPPSIQAHPQVLVMVATAFRRDGYTVDQLVDGWGGKVSKLGIYDYYSVNPWDHDMPAKGHAADIDYLKHTIPDFYSKGARAYSAESSDNWGPHGLGYFLAARMLWDVREANNTDTMIEEFLTNAFGPAKEPMREFYGQLNGSALHSDIVDQLSHMFQALYQARRIVDAPEIIARLDDLVLYARYVDLYQRYLVAQGSSRQEALKVLLQLAYRMRDTMMIHTKAILQVLPSYDKSVTIPVLAWKGSDVLNEWKSDQPFSRAELEEFVQEGITRYPLSKNYFVPISFNHDKTIIDFMKLPEFSLGDLNIIGSKYTIIGLSTKLFN
jgi:hypothetical protein